MNLLNHLLNNAKNIPNLPAVVADDGELSYKELFAYMLGFAKLLERKGAKKGDKVVIKCHQNAAYVAAVLGSQLAGCVMVPVEPDISQNRLDEIKSDIGDFVYFDEYSLVDFEKTYDVNIDIFDENSLPSDDDICEILFTTGTTGKPKGIVHTFGSEYAGFENIIGELGLKQDYRLLITTPLNHSFGIRRLFVNLIGGGFTAIIKGIVPLTNFKNALDKWKINCAVFNTSSMSMLMQTKELDLKECFSDFEYMQFSGSVLYDSIVEQIKVLSPNCKIFDFYGSTEFIAFVCGDRSSNLPKGCIGKPTKHSKIFILDDSGNELKDGEKGYLALKGKCFMKEYIGDKNATKSVINDKGMFVTQDICYKIDGLIYFVGRDSDVVNIGGLKVSPNEIEDIANTHPLVLKSACVGKPHKLAGAVPVLFVEVRASFDINEFYAFLRPKVESYEFPKEVIVIDKIPLTYNGKINRKELKARLKQ